MKQLFSCFILLMTLVSCHTDIDEVTLVTVNEYKILEDITPSEFINTDPVYICFSDTSDLSFSFKEISKIVIKNDKIFILESGNRRLLVFNKTGEPYSKMEYRGRGPKEYLQITDFDVDDEDNIWIVDAQKNDIYKYSDKCILEKSYPFQYEITKIACLKNQSFLCEIGSWDMSEYSGSQLVLADSLFNIKSVLTEYSKNTDPNFVFQSEISRGKDTFFYCSPIEDKLIEISNDGTIEREMMFDFGSRQVPEHYKKNIEKHYERINADYSFVFRTYRVCKDYITLGLHNNGWQSLILNCADKTGLISDAEVSGMSLIGQCSEGSIWQLHSSENCSSLPVQVQNWLKSDLDVIFILPDE